MRGATQLARQRFSRLVRVVEEADRRGVAVELVAEETFVKSQRLLEYLQEALRQTFHLTIEPHRGGFEVDRVVGPDVWRKRHVGKGLPVIRVIAIVELAKPEE